MKSATSSASRLTCMTPDSSRTRSSKSLISFSSRMPLECIVASSFARFGVQWIR